MVVLGGGGGNRPNPQRVKESLLAASGASSDRR